MGDWSTQRRGAPLADGGVAAHQVDAHGAPGRGDDVGQDGDHGPGRPRERGRGRNDPEPAVRAHGPGLERRLPGAAPPRVSRAAPSMSHSPADEGERVRPAGGPRSAARPRRSESVADVTRIWTRRTTGQTRCTCGPALRRAPAEQPTHQEADQAEHAQIVAAGRARPAQLTPGRRRDNVRRCTLNGSMRCWRRRLSGVTCSRTPFIVAGKQAPSPRASWPPTPSSTGTSSGSSR